MLFYQSDMKTIYLTPTQFKDLLLAKGNRPQPIWFIAIVEEPTLKTGNTLPGRLMKISRYKGWIGSYENSVNNQLNREGMDQLTFTAKPRKWGTRLNLSVVHHFKDNEDRYYLSAQILSAPNPLYLIEQTIQHARAPRRKLVGIAKEMIVSLLPPRKPEGTNQGTDKKIVYRDFLLSHITLMSFGGNRYRIVPEGGVINPTSIDRLKPVALNLNSPSHQKA